MRKLTVLAAGVAALTAGSACRAASVDFSWGGQIQSVSSPGVAHLQFGPAPTAGMLVLATNPADVMAFRADVVIQPLTLTVPGPATSGQDFNYTQNVFAGAFSIVDGITGHLWMTGDIDVTGQSVVVNNTDDAADVEFQITNVQVFAAQFTSDTGHALSDSPNLFAMAGGHADINAVATVQTVGGLSEAIADGTLSTSHSGTVTTTAIPAPAALAGGLPLLAWVFTRRRCG